jgi:hypothetical protein
MDRIPMMWATRPSVGDGGRWASVKSWNVSSKAFSEFVYWQCSLAADQDLIGVSAACEFFLVLATIMIRIDDWPVFR